MDKSPLLLLVENDPEFVYLFERYAQQGNWRLITTMTGQEAVSIVQQMHPDAVFINVRLATAGGGWGILKALKNDANTRAVPAVVYSSKQETEQAKREGADFSLCKPILFEDVKAIVDDLGKNIH